MAGKANFKSKHTLVAVDTNVLLDLACDDEIVLDCLATLLKRLPRLKVVVSPTVVQELADIVVNGHSLKARRAAATSLKKLVSEWGFQPFNYLPIGHGIVEETGRKIREKGLLPEIEVNDSFIIVEAGLIGSALLLSNDRHINEIDQRMLKMVLDAADISTPLIASPRKVVRDFFAK